VAAMIQSANKTQVVIIGAGPAGMLLSELLHRRGIESVVLDRHSREHVLARIRAGVLEPTTVEVLRANELGGRMDREGHPHDGMKIVWAGRESFFIDVYKHLGNRFMAYGQTNIQEDLFAAADRHDARVLCGAQEVLPVNVTSGQPSVTFKIGGETRRLYCDFIAGCDGFHGVSRGAIPASVRREARRNCWTATALRRSGAYGPR
jgi:p-hydroxybenzoate 3-monooxygenase